MNVRKLDIDDIFSELYKLSSRSIVKEYSISVMPVEGSDFYDGDEYDLLLNFSKEEMDQATELANLLPYPDFVVFISTAVKIIDAITGESRY